MTTAFIEYQLRIIGDKLPEGRKAPTLSVQVDKRTENRVWMTCDSGLFGSDQKQISIRVKLVAYAFGLCSMYASQIHSKEPGFKFPLIRCYGPRKKQPGQQGPARGLDGVIQVGKDQQGQCYISLLRKDPPHIKFVFRPGMWNELVDPATNQPLDSAAVSNYYAQAWARVMDQLVGYSLADPDNVYDYREDQQGGNQNGGGNGGHGGHSGGSASSAPATSSVDDTGWDNDIPM